MTDADRARFVTTIQTVADAFGKVASEQFLHVYWLALSDLDAAAFERGVTGALKASRFMPTPADIRLHSGGLTSTARTSRAWDALILAIRKHGAYASVDFDDPAVNAAVRNLGGWQRLCSLDSEELSKWIRKDFAAAYEGYVQCGVPADQGRYLVGIHEASSLAAPKPPVLIACETAKQTRRLQAV